jgi:excisionase family DNA binding protein
MVYRPVPIPPDFSAPDLTIGQAMFYLGLSARAVQRLCQTGAIESYRLGGDARRIVFASVRAYRQSCIDKGPQLSQRPTTGKRPRGRPRKARPARE